MSQEDVSRLLVELPRLVSAWQADSISANQGDFEKLTELLTRSSSARSYFLEAMQIEAELKWRFGSSARIEDALTADADGSARPVAAIVAGEVAFRDDKGFYRVYDAIQQQESMAHQWVQTYPMVRAAVFFCLHSYDDADEFTHETCEGIRRRIEHSRPAGNLREIAVRSVLDDLQARMADNPTGLGNTYLDITRRCLAESASVDTVALYESVESIALRQLPAAALRLLCYRYLIGLPPSRIAERLGVGESEIACKLSEARLRLLNRAAKPSSLATAPIDVGWLSMLSWLLDRPLEDTDAAAPSGQVASSELPLGRLRSRLNKRVNRQSVLIYLVLHEALHRTLSLNRLLELSKSHSDPALGRLVTEMVQEVESTSKVHLPAAPVRSANLRGDGMLLWAASIAATLLLAVTVGAWMAGRPGPSMPPAGSVADTQPAGGDSVKPKVVRQQQEPQPEPPPQRVVAGTVVTVLATRQEADTASLPAPGALLYADEELTLPSGVVQVATPSGNQWVLQGPANLVMKENDQVALRSGKIVGRNDGKASPLIVETPSAVVRDLGTEFGVSVREDAGTGVAVYEGAVELSSAAGGSVGESSNALNIAADHEVHLAPSAAMPVEAELLAHDRGFIRPDEVDLRVEEQAGSPTAAARVAFYDLLRIDGLLAYHGFAQHAGDENFTIGLAPEDPGAAIQSRLGADLMPGTPMLPMSRSIRIASGESLFLHFDTSERSLFAKQGLVDPTQRLGRQAGEIWLSWRSKIDHPQGQKLKWVGLSLMNGEERNTNEPLFLGQPSNWDTLGFHVYGDDKLRQDLDMDPIQPGIQPQRCDDQSHLWIVHVNAYGAGKALVQIYLDVEPAAVGSQPPNAKWDFEDFSFDRLRLEVSAEGPQGACSFDEIIVATKREAIVAASRPQ